VFNFNFQATDIVTVELLSWLSSSVCPSVRLSWMYCG